MIKIYFRKDGPHYEKNRIVYPASRLIHRDPHAAGSWNTGSRITSHTHVVYPLLPCGGGDSSIVRDLDKQRTENWGTARDGMIEFTDRGL